MTYATSAMVKRRCGIDTNDDSQDDKITDACTHGDAVVDNYLNAYGLDAGGSGQMLKEIAADFATSFYHLNEGNIELADRFYNRGSHDAMRIVMGDVGEVHRTGGPPYRPPSLDR